MEYEYISRPGAMMSELSHLVGSAVLGFGVVCLLAFAGVVLWQITSTRRRLERLAQRERSVVEHDADPTDGD